MNPRVWRTTEPERAAHYPCDDLAFAHDEAYFRAVDVGAPAAVTYRWLCQLRVAPYSYDLLDNFGRRSPPQLTPGTDRLETGARIMVIFRIVAFEAGSSLTIRLASRLGRALMGDFAGTYRVVKAGPRRSRLIAKVLVRYPRGFYGAVLRKLMPFADLVMFRKQLLTLRHYAQRDAREVTMQ